MKKRKLKNKKILLFILFFIFLSTFLVFSYKSIKWKKDQKKTNDQISEINESVEIVEQEKVENIEIIEQQTPIAKENPYWNYIKMNLINVDFAELEKKNSSTVGWIQVNGTNINYPFVKTIDNEYYLNHSFDHSHNDAGWVFMDYRNNMNGNDKNYIIYAHGRYDSTMFGSLKNILSSNWLKNTNNYIIKLSTKQENTLWQVFSAYKIDTTNDYLKINFVNNQDFLQFANMLLNRSEYNFKTSVDEKDQILTLSTCYDDKKKVVMHAKLIKKEKK